MENIRVTLDLSLNYRLQREEEEAFASSQSSQGAQSLTFSNFEEKKTNEKTRKVTTVKKFFSASSRVGAKKGNFSDSFVPFVPNETQNVCGLSFVISVSIQRYQRRLEMLGWRCR